MGSVGTSRQLKSISTNPNWYYKPRDDSKLYENPIPYMGNEETKDLIDHFYGWEGYKHINEKIEMVNLATLKSTQAFVTEQGLTSGDGEGKDVTAVRYKDNIYLLDGNHRVARAWLRGNKTYRMRVITMKKGE